MSLGPECGLSVSQSSATSRHHGLESDRMLQGHCRGIAVHGIRSCFLIGRWLMLQCNQCSVVTRFGTQRNFTAQDGRCKAW